MGEPESRDRPAPDLAVVIPVHNEQGNIGPLLDEVDAAFAVATVTIEIIVVDDGSTDGTREVLREARARRPNLTVVEHDANRGQSASLLTGVETARACWIATLDGDGQNDPGDIPELWAMVVDGNRDPSLKMVAGHRRKRQDTWLRRTSSRVANSFRGGLLGDRTPDTGCGLKLFERETFLRLPHFDHFHRFLPALVQRAGGRVMSVDVGHRPRSSGVSHYGVGNRLWVGLVDLLGVVWLGRRAAPWRVDVSGDGATGRDDEES